jgi:radical SAM protein with 4Fe4S-binding SPASM domain
VAKDPKYKVGFMEMELYKKIIDEMSQYKYSILRPFGDGETLLHPKIVEMVRYAKKKGILNIWMNTNGTLLTENICKDLLMTGINQMEISIDAATKETYDKIRIGGNFDTVIKNTLQCISLKKELFPTVEIIVSFVESTINIHEKEDFSDFWKDKADVVSIRPFHQHTGLVKENMRARQYPHKTRYPCPLLWTRASITYTGDLKYCENDWYNKKIVGNVKEKSIRNIWNSAEYRKLRSLHVKKRFSEIPLCKNCIDFFQIDW